MYGHFADQCRGRSEEWNQVLRSGTFQRTKSRGGDTAGPSNQAQANKRTHPIQNPETNVPAAGAPGAGPSGYKGPQDRSRPRQRQQAQWKPTGTVYPTEMKSLRPKDAVLDEGRGMPTIAKIPTSPNKFAALDDETRAEPIETTVVPMVDHQILPQDILTAVLEAISGNAQLEQPTPFVNADRRHRSKSRDLRMNREKAQNKGEGTDLEDDGKGKDPNIEVVHEVTQEQHQVQNGTSSKVGAASKNKHK